MSEGGYEGVNIHKNGSDYYWSPTVDEYDPAMGTWTRKADMPTSRNALATVAIDGKIYAIGGKANFGFVSKYKKGATAPTGNTEFQFKAAELNFHSSSYDWLVVNQNGTNAQFKGSGTINGEGDYRFMLWAGDDPDTFRIRIWEEDEISGVETDVYDNGFNQGIGGGSIVIHVK